MPSRLLRHTYNGSSPIDVCSCATTENKPLFLFYHRRCCSLNGKRKVKWRQKEGKPLMEEQEKARREELSTARELVYAPNKF